MNTSSSFTALFVKQKIHCVFWHPHRQITPPVRLCYLDNFVLNDSMTCLNVPSYNAAIRAKHLDRLTQYECVYVCNRAFDTRALTVPRCHIVTCLSRAFRKVSANRLSFSVKSNANEIGRACAKMNSICDQARVYALRECSQSCCRKLVAIDQVRLRTTKAMAKWHNHLK